MNPNTIPPTTKQALLSLLPVVDSYKNLKLVQEIVNATIEPSAEISEEAMNYLKNWLKSLDISKTLHKDLLPLYETLKLHEIT